MKVEQGISSNAEAALAVHEATAGWQREPEVVFAFTSTGRSPEAVAAELGRRFPEATVVGCTTAGELASGGHHRGALVVTGLVDSGVRWAARMVPDVATLTPQAAVQTVDALYTKLGVSRDTLDPHAAVALLFVDGLCRAEEHVAATLADALDGVPLAGGSAGDDLAFERSHVICGAQAASGAAVLLVGVIEAAEVRIIKHQHFASSDTLLAITRADPGQRRVYELDGVPALEAYAAALGLRPDEVDDAVTFNHPVTFQLEGTPYVRSIQQVHSDGSLSFYCAVEDGLVVSVARHGDMVEALRGAFDGDAPFEFLLGFNCILRALEAEQAGLHPRLSAEYDRAAQVVAGFDTYGEQLHGVHINQTLVAVAMRGVA